MKTKPNPSLRSASLTASIAFCFVSSAHAVTQYWTGAGTWNTGTNWSNTSGGPYSVAWNNNVADIAVFEGTGGLVTVGASRNVDQLNFNVTGYTLNAASAVTLTGTGATNYNLAANVTASIGANVTLQSSSTSQNWNIKGANKTTSILNLDGVIKNNTANASSLLDATVNVNTGGQLISLNSIVTGTATTGSGSVLNVSGGTVSIGGNASSLILNNTGAITADSSVTVSSGGSITFTDATNSGGIRFGATGGSANVLTQQSGTLNLDGGVVTVNKIFMGGSYTGGAVYNATVNFNGGTLKALKTNDTDFLTGIVGTGAIVKSGGAVIDSNTVNITIGQNLLHDSTLGLTLDGGLTKKSAGTLTLSGANTYTGATTISAGTLSAGSIVVSGGSSNLGNATSAVTLGTASTQGTLSYTGNSAIYTRGFTIGGAGGGRLDVTISSQTLQVNTGAVTGSGLFTVGGAGNTSIGANLTHTGGLTKADAGTLTLSGTNTFTGGVSVNGGALSFSSQANSGNGNLGSLASAKTITLGGGTLSYTGNATISSNNLALAVTANSILEVTDSAATLRSGGTLSGSGQLTINGPGVVALGQNAVNATYGNGFTGDIVVSNGATLSLRNPNSMGSTAGGAAAGTTTIQNGGTLLLDPFSQSSISFNSETLAFQGTSTLTNRLNGQSSLSTAITGSVSTAGTLTVNTRDDGSTSNPVSLELSGAITGNGGVNFGTTGGRTGTYIVSNGSNGYLGATNVKSGSLVINGNISTSSLTTVESGASLGGSGTVGALTVLSGGTLAPGNSPGTLTVGGALSLENLSIMSFELNPTDTTVGGGINDLITGVTNLTLDGLLNVTGTGSFAGVTSGVWRLFNYSGSLTNNIVTLNTMPTLDAGYSWALDTATANQVNLTIVPEPNTAALLGGLGILALLRRRRGV